MLHLRARLLVPVLLLASLTLAPTVRADDYDDALDTLKQAAKSKALGERVRAMEALAETHDPRAIEVLAKHYAAPKAPKLQQRRAVVSILARHFDRPQFTADLKRVRAKHASPEDAWLWYRTLVIHGRRGGMEDVWAHARDPELPSALRAAAIEAAATLTEGGVLDLVPDVLAQLPEDGAARARLVQSLAAAAFVARHSATTAAGDKAFGALIDYLATDRVAPATRVVLGRILQEQLDSRFAYLDGDAWKSHKQRPGATRDRDARRLLPVRIAKKKIEGQVVAYLIDVSAKAKREVTPELMDELLETKSHVGDRLGLMTHAVRESIRALKPEQSFLVVPYAHHGPLALPGLETVLPATYDNQKKAFDALRTLGVAGNADLHAGLDAAALAGVDTIVVFNHSVSHHDAFVAEDERRRVEQPRTTASGRMVVGTYAEPRWLLEELSRMRLTTKARVLGIPFGEADRALLDQVEKTLDGFQMRQGLAPEAEVREARGVDDDAYRKAVRTYLEYLKRPSMNKRELGRHRFASTGNLLAFETLTRDYARAEKPRPEIQQQIVDIVGDVFTDAKALPIYGRWRGRHTERSDAWLWHRALEVARAANDPAPGRRAAAEAHDPFLRAAAIRAMAKQVDEALLPAIPRWVAELRAAKAEGTAFHVPVEAMATAMDTFSGDKDSEAYKAAALALLDVFDDEKTPKRTKLTIVRNLASALEVPPDSLDKNTWVREVRAGGSGAGMRDTHYGAPTFGGLRASGTRIAYVIDMSDSMLTPLEPHERMKPRVITGQKTRKKRRPEDEIDWSKLKSRFDLARALLITSLQSLRPNTHFCVIWFGSEAGTLKATKKMVKSTPANIAKAVRELRAIKPGAPGAGKHKTGVKWGSLRGETNLHGGLYRAFNRTEGKPMEGFVYVNETGFEEGCDTIFVLSDGAPTTDDFTCLDKRDPNDRAVEDRETGKATKATPELNFHGPYGDILSPQLLNDIMRHNLFRQVEIHCLGIGEANMGFLGQIARIGLGESRKIGEDG